MIFGVHLLISLVGMEILSYIVHRYLFHGLLWRIHKTHHEAHHGILEWNDVFSTLFALVAIVLIILGANDPFGDPRFGLGIGITVYGMLYFVVHDLFTHRRFIPFSSESRLMRLIRRAHQRHHQSADRMGNEPYGLFLFPYKNYPDRRKKE